MPQWMGRGKKGWRGEGKGYRRGREECEERAEAGELRGQTRMLIR